MVSSVNGTYTNKTTLTIAQDTKIGGVIIGANNYTRNGQWVNGTIGEVRVWNGSRTNGWILAEDGFQISIAGGTYLALINSNTTGNGADNVSCLTGNYFSYMFGYIS